MMSWQPFVVRISYMSGCKILLSTFWPQSLAFSFQPKDAVLISNISKSMFADCAAGTSSRRQYAQLETMSKIPPRSC
ncbi:hypothetical protein F5Y16DRAFT_368853 [Xylariaceae sp. FL0255]|nr:hypothetical protein F5Y16DRAFT_368853 [Xylariaceae sp. FL0255]